MGELSVYNFEGLEDRDRRPAFQDWAYLTHLGSTVERVRLEDRVTGHHDADRSIAYALVTGDGLRRRSEGIAWIYDGAAKLTVLSGILFSLSDVLLTKN